MAKFGGERQKLLDIRTPFSIEPGGRAIDLSEGLDFYIRARNSSSAANIVDEVSNTSLTNSGTVSFSASPSQLGPISFRADRGFKISLDSEKYPSYLKDEQTLFIMFRKIRNQLGGPLGVANPNEQYMYAPSPPPIQSFNSGVYRDENNWRVLSGGTITNGIASGSLMWGAMLFTTSSITTGSHSVSCIPFQVSPAPVGQPFSGSIVGGQIRPIVFTYRDWIYDQFTVGNGFYQVPKLMAADIIAATADTERTADRLNPFTVLGSNVKVSGSNDPNQTLFVKWYARGRREKRQPPNDIFYLNTGSAQPGGPGGVAAVNYNRSSHPFGFPSGPRVITGSHEYIEQNWHTVVFRQRLGSTAKNDPGMMDVWYDGRRIHWQLSDIGLPEEASRFTVEDKLKVSQLKSNPATELTLNSTLKSISADPLEMVLGFHDYGIVAGWSRVISDYEVESLHEAAINGAFTDRVTSYTSPPLAAGHSINPDEQIFELSTVVSTDRNTRESTSEGSLGGFTDRTISGKRGISGSVVVSIPINTMYNENALGIAYRNHGMSGVGSVGDDTGRRGFDFENRKNNIHSSPIQKRLFEIADTQFDWVNYQLQAVANSAGSAAVGVENQFVRHPTGNAGSGFLYYSPKNTSWIEKRYTHSTSNRSYPNVNPRELWPAPNGSNSAYDYSGSDVVNVLEYNNDTPATNSTSSQWTFHITGADRIMGQFTGSPNIGYFMPWKESLESMGYSRIGWPTSMWGAPAEAKYHAFDDETIKVSDYIDRPFVLRGIELSLNIEAARMFVTGWANEFTSSLTQGHSEKWAKYIMNRRDIENYSFFIYRQRRRGGVVKDSLTDISSSERFLIASASLAFYNSSSFGGSYEDDYWLSSSIYLDAAPTPVKTLFYESASLGVTSSLILADEYGGTNVPLTLQRSPIHGPAFSYNWNVPFTTKSVETVRTSVNLRMVPAVAPRGITAPTLMTFAGGKLRTYSSQSDGTFANSVRSGSQTYLRPSWYHTGTFQHPFSPIVGNALGSGTYAYPVVHYWHGNTRILQEFPSGTKSNRDSTRDLIWFSGQVFDVTASSNQQVAPYQVPVQFGAYQYGLGYESSQPAFSQYTFYTSRETAKILPSENKILVDGRALNCSTIAPGQLQPYEAEFTTGSVSPAAQITFFKTTARSGIGTLLPGSLQKQKITETEYLLLPGDELVLGLENSNFATPDVTVLFPSGAYKDLVLDFLPWSYLRVIPGIGELKLIGKYLRDGEAYQPQETLAGDVTTVVGELPHDEFQVTETDAYYGGVFDEIITGSTDLRSFPLRGVAGHATAGDIKGNFSLNRFFTVYTDRYVKDYFDDPMRNTLRVTGSIPGITRTAFKIPQKAVLNSLHYGYLRDFIETPPYAVLGPSGRNAKFVTPPVTVRFVEKSSTQFEDVNEFQKSQTSPLSILGTNTTSQNVNKFARLDGPFKDNDFTDRGELEYTTTV